MPGPAWNAAVEAMLSTRPKRRATMPGRKRCVSAVSAVTFTCTISSSESVVLDWNACT